jgi:hypothetical protein
MTPYDTNHHGRINFFDLAGVPCTLFEPEPLNAFGSIDEILSEPEEPLESFFWDQPDTPYPWNLYWTEAARDGGGLSINDPVFGDTWTYYKGMHFGCEEDEVCWCEQHGRDEATTIGHAWKAQSTEVEIEDCHQHTPEETVIELQYE